VTVTDPLNLTGSKLGNYRLRKVLGRGNMGVVYLATDEALLRPTAVKVVAQDVRGETFELPAEGFLARALCHEIDHLDGILFIDRVDKVTRDRLKRQIKREGFREQPALSGAFRL